MQFQNSTIFLGEKFRCGIEFSAGQCVEWSRGRCKVIVIIWAIVKREGNCMAIYFHENCDRIIIPSVYFFPLKNACKVCSFWRSPTKLFQWSIIQTQVGIIKKCWDINCTFLFTDLIKKVQNKYRKYCHEIFARAEAHKNFDNYKI